MIIDFSGKDSSALTVTVTFKDERGRVSFIPRQFPKWKLRVQQLPQNSLLMTL